MDKKVLLMILDGWGEGRQDDSNVIYSQGAPYIENLRKEYPMALREYGSIPKACGASVQPATGQLSGAPCRRAV